MNADLARLLGTLSLTSAIMLSIVDAFMLAIRVREARRLDPSLVWVNVDDWPPEVLDKR